MFIGTRSTRLLTVSHGVRVDPLVLYLKSLGLSDEAVTGILTPKVSPPPIIAEPIRPGERLSDGTINRSPLPHHIKDPKERAAIVKYDRGVENLRVAEDNADAMRALARRQAEQREAAEAQRNERQFPAIAPAGMFPEWKKERRTPAWYAKEGADELYELYQKATK